MNLGVALTPLTINGLEEHGSAIQNLSRARPFLWHLGDERGLPLSLRASRPLIWHLYKLIAEILEAVPSEQSQLLLAHKETIYKETGNLLTLLGADLAHQPVFHVNPKRAFSTEALVSDGTRLFSEQIRDRLHEEEAHDFKEAAKCLAFELPTAAAFHLFRAVESVMRRYYVAIVGTLPAKKIRNWGAYLHNLKQYEASDKKIIHTLEQIKDLYRNPILHPETKITLDEALSLTGLAENLVSLMITYLAAYETTLNSLATPNDEMHSALQSS
jgi:hypothetical protein